MEEEDEETGAAEYRETQAALAEAEEELVESVAE